MVAVPQWSPVEGATPLARTVTLCITIFNGSQLPPVQTHQPIPWKREERRKGYCSSHSAQTGAAIEQTDTCHWIDGGVYLLSLCRTTHSDIFTQFILNNQKQLKMTNVKQL